MKILNYKDRNYEVEVGRLFNRLLMENERIEKDVRKILNEIRLTGDEGIQKYTLKFEGFDAFHASLKVDRKEIREAWDKVDAGLVESLKLAAERIRLFHERQKTATWKYEDEDGNILGQLVRPIESVGLYVPGGKASYPSSVLMNAIPAIVAGVNKIVICTPSKGGEVNPAILVAADILGLGEIYKIGGAQAIAALAYGSKSIPKVDKIVGPGNIYVATAKRIVYGAVDIDMVAGPSEVVVVADDTAESSFVAADLLAQAEHDEDAFAICITISEKKAEEVINEVKRQVKNLDRVKIAEASIKKNGIIIVEKDIDSALEIANRIAPEHLELVVENPFELIDKVKNAGALFLGSYTPEVMGDYVAGPNHVLPTGGTARFYSPLSVDDFIKKTSLLHFTKKGFFKYAKHAVTIAKSEQLDGHAKSAEIRLNK